MRQGGETRQADRQIDKCQARAKGLPKRFPLDQNRRDHQQSDAKDELDLVPIIGAQCHEPAMISQGLETMVLYRKILCQPLPSGRLTLQQVLSVAGGKIPTRES